MSVVPRVKLSEVFGLFEPTYLLGTTYTLSLAFFEATVFPRIRRKSLRRCLLLADQMGFQRALWEATALRGVGRDYMAISVPCSHSFHPKVWVMIGSDEAAVLCGSGNLTQSGFVDNVELFDAVHFHKSGPHRAVAEGVAQFLTGLHGQWAGAEEADLLVLDSMAEMRDAVSRLAAEMPPDPRPKVRFLSNYPEPLLDQLAPHLGGGTLFVAAPYFGGTVEAVRKLKDTLSPRKLRIFPAIHTGDALDVPIDQLRGLQDVSVHRLALGDGEGFAHLKLYGADTAAGSWVFTTSANCTLAALAGQNVEAGLLRRISRPTLRAYFAKADGEPVPTQQRQTQFLPGPRWLPLCATERGAVIELVAGGAAAGRLPIRDVEITLRVGYQTRTRQRDTIFAHGTCERLSWDFFGLQDRPDSPPLMVLRGTGPGGGLVEGAAFVDQPLWLTSEPIHRSAWRATLAILDGEGLPDASDLACVFHLVHDIFEPGQSDNHTGKSDPGWAAPARAGDEPEEKVGIWPPFAQGTLPRGLSDGHHHPVAWFQRILSELLAARSGESEGSERTSGPADAPDEGDPEEAGRVTAPPRVVNTVWDLVARSFDDLLTRVRDRNLTPAAAPKLWPVAVAILLVSLSTRRTLGRQPGASFEGPSPGEIVARFLRAVFGDRFQPWRHRMALYDDDSPTDPSVAAELHERFGVVLADDLAGVLLLLFAYHHADARRRNRSFFIDGWLVFRDIAPGRIASGPPAEADILFRRFLGDNQDGIGWTDVAESLAALPVVGWPDLCGYRELAALVSARQDPGAAPRVLPEHMRDLWEITRRRIRAGERWCSAVERFDLCCRVRNCPRANTLETRKRALAHYRPVICSGCGSVLVPRRLLHEYEERNGHAT